MIIGNKVIGRTIYFARLDSRAKIPTKRDEDANYDLYGILDEDYLVIQPHQTVKVRTGLISAYSKNYNIKFEDRGSTGNAGLKTCAGVMDSGFRGEWWIMVNNLTDKPIILLQKELEDNDLTDKLNVYLDKDNKRGLVTLWKENGSIHQRPDDRLTIYPLYQKALCSFQVRKTLKNDVLEIDADTVASISSDRGTGHIGSSGK